MSCWLPQSVHHGASIALGEPLPPHDVHGVSVSLPSWASTVGWATRDAATIAGMKSGYPRFFVHPLITELASRLNAVHGPGGVTQALLLSSERCAERCSQFIERQIGLERASKQQAEDHEALCGEQGQETGWYSLGIATEDKNQSQWSSVHVVWFQAKHFPFAKAYWQHAGEGISSRRAVYCGEFAGRLERLDKLDLKESSSRDQGQSRGRAMAKSQDAQVITSTLLKSVQTDSIPVSDDDVWLHLSGMKAMTDVTRAIIKMHGQESRRQVRMVAFGFLYTDTFKVLSKVEETESVMRGHGSSQELDQLEAELEAGERIAALFCEFPTNPLLTCVDLVRIRELANRYGFVVVCDDTVGTSANVSVLEHVDVLVTSLTKLFSGACNVMGGSVIVNPRSSFYSQLQAALDDEYEDLYFPEDVAIMARNCVDFEERVELINANALEVARILQAETGLVKHVFYPGVEEDSVAAYERHRKPTGGYGYLMSVKFVDTRTAEAFFDGLDVCKGPSLGTNFTLACPYTYFAHYHEQEWAASFGVDLDLVRISVGLEKEVASRVQAALEVARLAMRSNM